MVGMVEVGMEEGVVGVGVGVEVKGDLKAKGVVNVVVSVVTVLAVVVSKN